MDTEYESKRLRALAKLNVLDTEPENTFDAITKMVSDIFDAPVSQVSMVDKDRLYFKSSYGLDIDQIDRKDTFCDLAIETKEPLIVTDASQDKRFINAAPVSGEPFFKFYAGVPLVTNQGFPVGTLCFIDYKPRPPLAKNELQKLQTLAELTISNLEIKASHKGIDANTELPTELVAIREINHYSAKHGNAITLLAIELLGLELISVGSAAKGVNYNSVMAKASASRLLQSKPEGSKIYYLGMDRYLCIVFNSCWNTETKELKGFIDKLSQPLFINNKEYLPNVKIGLKTADKPAEIKAEALIRHAISAQEQARTMSTVIASYTDGLDSFLSQRFELLSQLPQALKETEQFYLVFQPLVNTKTGLCTEIECLMRLNIPDYGEVNPNILIPLIESTPLMQMVTQRVIELAQEALWYLNENKFSPKFAINISSCDLFSDAIINQLKTACKNVGKNRLIVELTETAIARDLKTTFSQLASLRECGLLVHVDDFGVGQSSLSYLASIPADAIKLDRSFVVEALEKPRNIQVAKSIRELAQSLGFEVVLEGVEDNRALDIAHTIAPNAMQGYAITKPMKLNELVKWMQEQEKQ